MSIYSWLYTHVNYVCISAVIAVIIIGIIWYCKRSQKYHINNGTQSGVLEITNASVELQENPSYATTIRNEVHPTNEVSTVDEEVDIEANPSYTPFLKSDNEVNPLHIKQEAVNLLYSSTKDVQNTEYDYI